MTLSCPRSLLLITILDQCEDVPYAMLLSTENGAADNIAKEDVEFSGIPQKEVNDPVLPQSLPKVVRCT